jgi:hypothetical protein
MAPVAREVFEYEMIPWIGRDYAAWLRTSARPHPSDPHRLVLLPERIYGVFQAQAHAPGERATPEQLKQMGYPRLPEDDELEAARKDEQLAALAGDAERLRQIHSKIEQLEAQAELARRALETWQRMDPTELESRIAWELAEAPHADIMVGIPPATALR